MGSSMTQVSEGLAVRAVLDRIQLLRTAPKPHPVQLEQTIDDVRRWQDDLAAVGPLHFVELAALLRDRPRPPRSVIEEDAAQAKELAGRQRDHAPVWARALLDSLIAGQRLLAHLQASMANDFAALAAGYPACASIWQPRSPSPWAAPKDPPIDNWTVPKSWPGGCRRRKSRIIAAYSRRGK